MHGDKQHPDAWHTHMEPQPVCAELENRASAFIHHLNLYMSTRFMHTM